MTARAEVAEYAALCARQSELLRGVGIALKGSPPPLTLWSHHDLPELAAALTAELNRARAVIAEIRAVTRDGSVTYSVNNSDDLAVRAGLQYIEMSPMMVERDALDAILDRAEK